MIYVTGPGHGAPGVLSCLWIEGSLAHFYNKYSRDKKGLSKLIADFSVTGGLPSHINAETPGSIHEGGELGYSLAVAYGAVMDNPDLIATCVIGDGEAETGPTAAAWHGHKFIDPAESGAVIPVLHANGFKISERTLSGTMDNKEIGAMLVGYGYDVTFVEDLGDIDNDMASAMEWAYAKIRVIQKKAREGKPEDKPRWPAIVLRTPKGWTGPKILDGQPVEGSFRSHQVPLPLAKTDRIQLKDLNDWLSSYKPHELFDEEGAPRKEILSIIPKSEALRMGTRKECYAAYSPLKVPEWSDITYEKNDQVSPMKAIAVLLEKVCELNPRTMRVFSPDELVSNKLSVVFDDTSRNFQWDPTSAHRGGRVIEMLSEHTLQGMMQGYTLTGRTGLFPSYESFLGIITTMMVQFAKFAKMGKETSWRQDFGSINYISTSTAWRQEHNGFSHQNPGFIGAVLNLKPQISRVYFPPDANTFLSVFAHCLRSRNTINLMVAAKHETPVWLSTEEARRHCIAGCGVWKFASTDEGVNPDVVIVGIGVEMTFEVIAAAALLRKRCPELRVRVVNVVDLMVLSKPGQHPHALDEDSFNALFPENAHVHFNFHGYPRDLASLLFDRAAVGRITIGGYMEEGTTTTPFNMLIMNKTSRFHVAEAAIRGAIKTNAIIALSAHELISDLQHDVVKISKYILENSKDPEHIYGIPEF